MRTKELDFKLLYQILFMYFHKLSIAVQTRRGAETIVNAAEAERFHIGCEKKSFLV